MKSGRQERLLAGRGRRSGFSLIEVAIALGIASFVLIVLIGMFPVGLASHRDAERETLAVSIMNSVVADLKNSPTNQATTLYGISPHPLAGAGTAATTNYFAENEQLTNAAGALCRTEIYPMVASARGRGVSVRVFWPAQAAANRQAGAVETYAFVPNTP